MDATHYFSHPHERDPNTRQNVSEGEDATTPPSAGDPISEEGEQSAKLTSSFAASPLFDQGAFLPLSSSSSPGAMDHSCPPPPPPLATEPNLPIYFTPATASESVSNAVSTSMAAGVLIDTSGYASDCNFSDLMPQHAMKPFRFLATMELIKALRIVDKANEWASNTGGTASSVKSDDTETKGCCISEEKKPTGDTSPYSISCSYRNSKENHLNNNPTVGVHANPVGIEGKNVRGELQEKIILDLCQEVPICQEFRKKSAKGAEADGGSSPSIALPLRTMNDEESVASSSMNKVHALSSPCVSGNFPQGSKRGRGKEEMNTCTSKEGGPQKSDAPSFSSLCCSLSSEIMTKKEEKLDVKGTKELNRHVKLEPRTTDCFAVSEDPAPPVLPAVTSKRRGGTSTGTTRRVHVGIKMPRKTARRRPPPPTALSPPAGSSLSAATGEANIPEGGDAKDGVKGNSFALEEKISTSTACYFPCNFVKVSPLPPINFSSSSKGERVVCTNDAPPSSLPPLPYRIIVPPLLSLQELERVHAITYLGNLGLHNTRSWEWMPQTSRAYFSVDCPPVEGIIEHSLATASGTLMGAVLLNARRTNLAIHWGGGMHHTKCGECSGFCYVNDIVLGIVELLRAHEKVLYIDLDAHHGDGVDEAFCQSNRVFTLSLHKFGDGFFPGTGHPRDTGFGDGLHYTMNLSLWDGITDYFYVSIFSAALKCIVSIFCPDAIVLQCGADSLGGDRLGTFNLSSWGHGACVQLVKETGLPLLVLGGGGYTIRNVAKLWAYETAILFSHPGTGTGSPILVPPNAGIPVENMPLSGWLFVDQPQLLVPADGGRRLTAGWQVQRGLRAVLDQIDFAMEKLKVVEDARRKAKEKKESLNEKSTSNPMK